MIKMTDNSSEILQFDKTDIFSIRIFSLLQAYGTDYDFAMFYIQADENGRITAIMSKLDGDFTLSVKEGFDADELDEFFSVVGYNTILCEDSVALPRLYDYGAVMKTYNKVEKTISYAQIDEYPKLMDIFSLDDYDKTDFEAWYVDVSHRIRHGCAAAYTLNVNGEIISSAMFSSIYGNNAILSAVKTDPSFRNLGYGTALVSHMLFEVKGDVFLMRNYDKNKEFYEKLGFKDTGIWRMYK